MMSNQLKQYFDCSETEKIIIDFKDKIKVVVGSGVIKIKTSEEMDLLLVYANLGNIYEYIGETNEKYVNGALYIIEEE